MLANWFSALGLVSASMVLVACGGDDAASTTPPGEAGEDPNVLEFTTGEFEVAPGDTFTCFYTDHITAQEYAVNDGDGQQGPGGHHIIVYYADEPREVGYHPCTDEEMVNLHQISGSGGEPAAKAQKGLIGLPDGLALKVPAGKQLVLQAHYINTTGQPQRVNDTVQLKLVDPATVKAYVNYLVTLDDTFEIPANAKHESTKVCTLQRDFDMVLHLGHMHELGERYRLDVLDDQGNVAQTLHDEEWNPVYTSHPPVTRYSMEEPLKLSKGTKLRQTCTWNNVTPDPVLFPREMCLAFFYYFPAEDDLVCYMDDVEPSDGGAQ